MDDRFNQPKFLFRSLFFRVFLQVSRKGISVSVILFLSQEEKGIVNNEDS